MVTNARIADLIRENKPESITDAVAEGDFFQMQTFSQALISLVCDGVVDKEVAANAASSRHDFLVALEREQRVRNAAAAPDEPQLKVVEPEPGDDELSGLRIVPVGQ
jgi:Tfp pilus assembly ATPase PilU